MKDGATFAVIARTHQELNDIQRELLLRKIPFRKAEGQSLFDCPEVQVYAALLRTLVKPTPNDLDLVLAWAGMTSSDTQAVRELFGNNIRQGALKDFNNSAVTQAGATIWRSFAKRHQEWTERKRQGSFNLLNVGVHDWLLETLQKPNSDRVLETAAALFLPKEKSLEKHLADLAAAEKALRNRDKEQEDGAFAAWLMTAHGSKGLEFDRVWMIGLNTGTFPSEKSALEEERRLMYVGMTRARQQLNLSATNDKRPSVFVYEAELEA